LVLLLCAHTFFSIICPPLWLNAWFIKQTCIYWFQCKKAHKLNEKGRK
jgi:hypothetical protein